MCGNNTFNCSENFCIPKKYELGGKFDCPEENDEIMDHCEINKLNFSCDSGKNIDKCLLSYDSFRVPKTPYNFLLDSLRKCNRSECDSGEYLCKFYKYCIKIDQYCDGIHDCLLGDDEIDCGTTTTFK